MIVHFRAKTHNSMMEGQAECKGYLKREPYGFFTIQSRGQLTADTSKVTCEQCRETKAFMEAIK